ncbi:hypothetical protein ACBJ59_36035 [Nonomuraea sp. MTCD27]|uniref:hypothetical protein n=1 Tax=Nonomuraea sp. MTCD27 TaxID=1676747 RepID=UPI0035C0045D
MAHRETQRTSNSYLIVTKGTEAGRNPASVAYVSHVLDPAGISPRMLRSTRLIDLVNTMDPKLVAAAFGMNPEGVMTGLTHVGGPSRAQPGALAAAGAARPWWSPRPRTLFRRSAKEV